MVLITGASSGIGKSCAEAYAKQGKNLFLVARRLDRLKRLKQELEKNSKVDVQISALDVSNKKAVEGWGKENAKTLSQVSILVNNAGLAQGVDLVQDARPENWDVMWDTNVKGLLYVTHQLLAPMVKNKSGHIVNIGSVAGRWVYPKGNIYCATKRAVSALTEALRLDLSGTGIRVTEISPGMVETEFSLVRLKDEKKAKAVYAGLKPLTAEDIAETVVWSTSRPSHVNIQELIVYPTDQASPYVVNRIS